MDHAVASVNAEEMLLYALHEPAFFNQSNL